jgi:Derlin-2/3
MLLDVPIVSRLYLLSATLTSVLCALDYVSPLALYFNTRLIARGQVWRLVTTFLYFGSPGLDFCLHMYFLVRYCRLLEEEREFRNKTADFVALVLFGMASICLIAPFLSVTFFGASLTSMMVYIWGRRNEHVRMSFLGLFPFRAPYLAWVLFFFSAVLSGGWHSMVVDGIGIFSGHVYFYIEDVLPEVAKIRGWPPFTPLKDFANLLRRFAVVLGMQEDERLRPLPDAGAPRPLPQQQQPGEVLMM